MEVPLQHLRQTLSSDVGDRGTILTDTGDSSVTGSERIPL